MNQTLKIKVRDDRYCLERYDEASGIADVQGVNDLYGFSIRRNAPLDDWFLEQVLPLNEATDLTGRLAARKGQFRIGFFQHYWDLLVAAESFRIQSATEAQSGGLTAVNLKFEVGPEANQQVGGLAIPKIRNGNAVLLKDYYYVPVSFEAEVQYENDEPAQIKMSFTYDLESASYPLVTRRVQTIHYKGEKDEQIIEETFNFEKVPFDAFRLTAYGLNEPGFARRGTPRWIWLALASAALLMLVGLILRGKIQRGSR